MTRPYKFVVVDDNPDARFFAERTLKRVFAKCQVISASAAPAALDLVNQHVDVDAVVTDNALGGMSGSDLISELRRSGLTCPIVMITCSGNPDVSDKAYKAGATRVFYAADAGDDSFAFFIKEQLASAHGRRTHDTAVNRLSES